MVAIVLLPGMDGTGAMFAGLASALKEECRTIVVSYPETQPLGYRELEAYARAALPTDEPYILLGESFSGPIAISLAASKPAGLKGLVLCCTFARNPVPWLSPLKGLVKRLPFPYHLTSLSAPFLFGRFSTADLRSTLRQVLSRVPTSTLRARLCAVLGIDFSQKMREVEVPILYLRAAEDRIVSKSASRYMQALVPTMKIIELKAPHLLLQAIPIEAGKIVGNFAMEATTTFNSSLNRDGNSAAAL
ncbi:alpha/beta fold hydrolase [Janthinobacterium sp. 17J80-10]|uniref:alpha/beta fold hydrolase n=1 Tax=Janthinobacterium sp. 17J80-10 TaxID=2497863 RepID=UPI001F50E3B5|nr:alpha/beta fold hydrolase [Janthinobacterium sp. 17J80-10]